MDPRGTVVRIYTLLHTKYESSGPCGFREDFFLCFSHCMSMGANDLRGGAIFDSMGMIGRIYKEDLNILLHIKYKSLGPCGFGEENFFLCFSHDAPPGAGPFGSQGHGWQDLYSDHYTLLHTKYESSGHCGFGEKDFFMFSHDPPGRGPYEPYGHGWQDL